MTFKSLFLVIAAFVIAASASAQTTYSTATGNFTSVTQDNNNPPYAGEYNPDSTHLALYANGGNGNVGNNPQIVNFRTFTTDGTDMASVAQSLQVGQSFTVTLSAAGSKGINGNSIGFSLNNSTTFTSTSNYNTGSRFEYSFTGGDGSAAIYAGGGKQTGGLPGQTDFQNGLTYTFTLVSTNEFNFTVSGAGGATYNVGTLGGTSGATISSFSLFNRGYNNNDAAFSTLTVANVGTIGLTANSGETKVVTGTINDVTNTMGTSANSINKLGVGTVQLTAANTFTGATTVSAGTLALNATGSLGGGQATHTSGITVANGGTLLFGGTAAVTDRIHDATPLTLSGGTLNTAGLSEHGAANNSAGIGALTLQVTSTLDLGNGTSILAFANSAGATWTAGAKLNIFNWTGNTSGGGTDQLYFGSNATGLTAAQLANVEFFSDAGTTDLGSGGILANGEIVPVPEPATWLAGFLVFGGAAYLSRRRLRLAA